MTDETEPTPETEAAPAAAADPAPAPEAAAAAGSDPRPETAPPAPAPRGPDGKRIPPPPRGPVRKAPENEGDAAKPRRRRRRSNGGKGGQAGDGRGRGPGDRPRRSGRDDGTARERGNSGGEADTGAEETPVPDTGPRVPTEEEKAKRKERVAAAKDALSRSVGEKGDHVAPARTVLKEYLRHLNDPNQPTDERFSVMLEAPFRAPPKKRGTGFPGGRR